VRRRPYNTEHPRFRARVARIDISGQRFGSLVALEDLGTTDGKQGDHRWRCQCDCGRTHVVYGVHLRFGRIRSCGNKCPHHPRRPQKHGGDRTLLSLWRNMLSRCENQSNSRFASYGGRGISVCAEWHVFERFCLDMGPRPSREHSLDRVNNDGNYEPGNCRWATRLEQQRNMRSNRLLTWDGETLTLSAWAERAGLSGTVLATRLRRGWSMGEALAPRKFVRSRGHEAA
jgi:hypothetical protein